MASLDPVSPPSAKRQRTEAVDGETSFSESSPAKRVNGGAAASDEAAPAAPSFASAPVLASAPAVNANGDSAAPVVSAGSDDDEDEEEEMQAPPEEEDLSRRDMYLDTVRPPQTLMPCSRSSTPALERCQAS